MERKSKLPASNPSQPVRNEDFNLNHKLSTNNSTSSLSSSNRPDNFVSQISAVFKRHKTLGTMQNFSRASRVLVPQAETSKTGNSISSAVDRKVPQAKANKRAARPLHDRFDQNKDSSAEIRTNLTENSSCDPSSINSTVTSAKIDNSTLLVDHNKISLAPSSFHEELKKEEFPSAENLNITFQKGEEHYNTQQPCGGKDSKQHDIPNIDVAKNATADHMITEKKDEFRHYSTTQSSAIGYSCVTTMSVHSGPSYQSIHAPYSVNNQLDVLEKKSDVHQQNQQSFHTTDEKKENIVSISDASNLQPQIPPPPPTTTSTVAATASNASSNVDSKLEKAPRKKKYDPDVFFKVNGKLYQKLGKIGSGGSSEVYKVITSDCTICALKKIKLKGRDYPTAYGFCQEIKYLNKLKGKHNIIQLINYEVTDKSLLEEVMNGSMNVKDKKVKDEQYIYMVLEYGEIDLAHMLSHKWKEADDLSLKIDDNWLRFYWQQMLEAVNTVHEERIVHSDLKPANFLLVRGSLKLIDFGIAKAILSDTTNIQRDAQVGTLNYMAPEAFMRDEEDQNGNKIKCGRPSDVWSLGCILYQMVYGKTPFSEYKTFWAKYKVITDRNHEINYEPISNPLLIDLMKKCLAWDRNERWKIPQLLQHPFLLPPIPKELPLSLQGTYLETNQLNHLFEKVNKHKNDRDVKRLCSELFGVINDRERENK